MSTVAELLSRAKRRYALPSNQDDPVFADAMFLDRLNELLQEAAEEARAFRETFTLNLSNSTPLHPLDLRLIRIIDGTLRVDYNGDATFSVWPKIKNEQELRAYFGVIETYQPGVPWWYYTQRADDDAAMLNLVLYPQSDTAVTGGIKFDANVYPLSISDTSTDLPLQLGEERFLMPGLILAAAEVELNRGRATGATQIAYWRPKWDAALADWREYVEQSQEGSRRRIQYVGGYPDSLWG